MWAVCAVVAVVVVVCEGPTGKMSARVGESKQRKKVDLYVLCGEGCRDRACFALWPPPRRTATALYTHTCGSAWRA